MKEYYFERMEVWLAARYFTKDIYIVSKNFPEDEKYGMTSQIRRASVSVVLNIAEGMARRTDKEKARFINIAYSSAIEVINCLILSNDFEWLTDEKYKELRLKMEHITNQLNSLYRALTKK